MVCLKQEKITFPGDKFWNYSIPYDSLESSEANLCKPVHTIEQILVVAEKIIDYFGCNNITVIFQ